MNHQNLLLLRENLSEAMRCARRETLHSLVVEFVQILNEQNYQLDDLVETLAQVCKQQAYLDGATQSLEQAARQISLVREELR